MKKKDSSCRGGNGKCGIPDFVCNPVVFLAYRFPSDRRYPYNCSLFLWRIASGVYRCYYDTKSIVLPQAAGRGYRIRIFTAWLDPECGTAGCSLSVRKNNSLRYHRYYYLQVDITDPVTGVVNTITSQGYRKPIHRYLASNQVRIYTDRSGWKHYLEDFQYKERMKDPGIFDDRPMEFEETTAGSGHVVQILFVVIFILMALTSIFQNF